ncbi:glycoside hydrolase/deacetylase [Lophium mytilinum]|uniref:Glycoside hydrolase/deacetylase n=1 Tax=Lophium mytilinum TaxID=390894 RepID=A0A6A6R9K4_9PEZI|nr:glycoside hydrolase/deacetylase [Lophium mytilinum]
MADYLNNTSKNFAGIASTLDAGNADPLYGSEYDFPRDLIGYGRESLDPQWPNGAKIAISFVINYEEGAERTVSNGDEQSESHLWEQSNIGPRVGVRQINAESDYDYGSRVGIWRLLNLFEAYKFPVTAYAVGLALEKNPAVAKAFLDGGHEIASHAYRWVDYFGMTADLESQYINRQLDTIIKLTGSAPVGWYMGRLSPYSKALIHKIHEERSLPLLYEADCYDDDLPHWVDVPAENSKDPKDAKGMLMIPYSYDCNDLKFHSPHGLGGPGAFEEHLKNAFDTLYDEGLKGKPKMMTIGLHCRIIPKPGRFPALKRFVEYVASKPDVWVTTRKDIAIHFRERFPYSKK